jgi:predicted N-acetyltransferase YhbS
VPRFRGQRYNHEVPLHRWFIRNPRGQLVAHAAVHDKTLGSRAGPLRIGGVAEVCVQADYRGQKLVSRLLEPAHTWMREHGLPFAMLFGNPKVYASCGYFTVANPLRYFDDGRKDCKRSANHLLP